MDLNGPVVVVHNIDHARDAVIRARKLGRPVTLISAPGAAASLGADVFVRMIGDAVDDAPDNNASSTVDAVIDCGPDPGQAMQALRAGCRNIRLDADAAVLAKLREMTDGMVLDGRPLAALDLADVRPGDGKLDAWLAKTEEPAS